MPVCEPASSSHISSSSSRTPMGSARPGARREGDRELLRAEDALRPRRHADPPVQAWLAQAGGGHLDRDLHLQAPELGAEALAQAVAERNPPPGLAMDVEAVR